MQNDFKYFKLPEGDDTFHNDEYKRKVIQPYINSLKAAGVHDGRDAEWMLMELKKNSNKL